MQAEDSLAIVAATGLTDAAPSNLSPDGVIAAARDFALPLLEGRQLDTGETAGAHAQAVAQILAQMGASPQVQASAYLLYAADALHQPQQTLTQLFGESHAALVGLARRLVQVQRSARSAASDEMPQATQQLERVRKMLLAFSSDLRVVLLRLASRLQTLRWHAASRSPCPRDLALESLQVFAPLANRLGIWSVKWELEDLAFRFLQPQEYQRIAGWLDARRSERELEVEFARHQLLGVLRAAGIDAEVRGRPKHLYSIWKKMQGKGLAFEQVLDLRALRVVVDDVAGCYAALAAVHARYRAVEGEFDDYIARPKPNGYQSLHTVVMGDDGKPLEVQIRTRSMHRHAEQGVAAHWAYKEAGARGYAGVAADSQAVEQAAQARHVVMQQLLAWERDLVDASAGTDAANRSDAGDGSASGAALAPQRIYVLTPQARVVELSPGATPVDFAYALHTDLGHRCRGARVDGQLVPLNTPLLNGQVVEVVAAREGGPSMDWLNPELGYLAGARARAKVRAWFNAQALQHTAAKGRELVERLLQREGRTALKHDELAQRLGLKDAQALFEVVGKDELSLRQIESLLRPADPVGTPPAEEVALRRSKASSDGVLVVGVESLMTSLARCCRPAPPDDIEGFVTRGKGVAVHRRGCSNLRHMARQSPDRRIAVTWGVPSAAAGSRAVPVFPVDVDIEAADRQGLLRDISDVLAKERLNVTGVRTHSARGVGAVTAHMTFTVEVPDTGRLQQVLKVIERIQGVSQARRR